MPRFDVTLAGEVNLDIILYGLPEKLLPEREVLAESLTTTLGGSSAIVAHNLAALGNRVGFQSLIGDDPLGRIALDRLKEGGVDTTLVRSASAKMQTGLSVILQHETWRSILTYSGTIANLRWDDLDFNYLTDSRHFHFSSFYLQTALQPRVAELFKKLKAAGLTISLDTNDDPDDRFAGGIETVLSLVDVFMPNAHELKKIAGTDDVEAAIAKLATIVPLVVVKLGADGAIAQQAAKRFVSPPVRLEVVDPVGAGDSFNAGFLTQYVRGKDIPTCLAQGNLAGALSTTRPGGTEAFRDQTHREDFFRRHGGREGFVTAVE
ncbi:MAG: carbohydrate kinase family protein [Acidobacteriales bacterium]|nr:carbohydrate kinase family protein [Terriglobales bacterium]